MYVCTSEIKVYLKNTFFSLKKKILYLKKIFIYFTAIFYINENLYSEGVNHLLRDHLSVHDLFLIKRFSTFSLSRI